MGWMYNMSKEQRELLEQRKKARKRRRIAIGCACALVAVGALSAVFLVMQPPTARARYNDNGDLVVRYEDVSGELTYVRHRRGSQNLIMRMDESGVVRTAFNVCETCYASGRATYTQSGSSLLCENCRESVALSTLGNPEWGGCQPVAIPLAYRADSEDEVVIPAEMLQYAEYVFEAWDLNNFEFTLASYVPRD